MRLAAQRAAGDLVRLEEAETLRFISTALIQVVKLRNLPETGLERDQVSLSWRLDKERIVQDLAQ